MCRKGESPARAAAAVVVVVARGKAKSEPAGRQAGRQAGSSEQKGRRRHVDRARGRTRQSLRRCFHQSLCDWSRERGSLGGEQDGRRRLRRIGSLSVTDDWIANEGMKEVDRLVTATRFACRVACIGYDCGLASISFFFCQLRFCVLGYIGRSRPTHMRFSALLKTPPRRRRRVRTGGRGRHAYRREQGGESARQQERRGATKIPVESKNRIR